MSKHIHLIATGGTIAGVAGSATATSGYAAATQTVEDLLSAVPDIHSLAQITAEQFCQIPSEDMIPDIWLKLSTHINTLLTDDTIDGVVITHGTDTLEETAYFLNLTIHSEKPVVLTGAMRPATALSADGPMNMFQAVATAASDHASGMGVLVVMNDCIHAARGLGKTNTHQLNAFSGGVIGQVVSGQPRFYYTPLRHHTTNTPFDLTHCTTLPTVAIIYEAAGTQDIGLTAAFNSGVQGVVIAATGSGTLNATMYNRIKAGFPIPVVRSSRTGCGLVPPNGDVEDDRYGTLSADDLNPQKARVLLMLALTLTSDVDEIREMFEMY